MQQYLMIKNANNSYKRANRIVKEREIVKERVKEKENRMWKLKYKEMDSMDKGSRSTEAFSKELTE